MKIVDYEIKLDTYLTFDTFDSVKPGSQMDDVTMRVLRSLVM